MKELKFTTFVEDVLVGKASIDDFERYHDLWNENTLSLSLHEFLGFLWAEYSVYMELEEAKEYVIAARRLGQDLRTYLEPRRDDGQAERDLWQEIVRFPEPWEALKRGESGEPWRVPPGPVHPDTAKLITSLPR